MAQITYSSRRVFKRGLGAVDYISRPFDERTVRHRVDSNVILGEKQRSLSTRLSAPSITFTTQVAVAAAVDDAHRTVITVEPSDTPVTLPLFTRATELRIYANRPLWFDLSNRPDRLFYE